MKPDSKQSAAAARASLTEACLTGDVRALQGTSCDINAPVFEGLRPIHLAAAAGQAEAVAALANSGANLELVDCPLNQNTALHFAVLAGKDRVVEVLLKCGVNTGPKNCVETTPVLDAARTGNEAILRRLLASGAKWEEPNGYGNTILHRAAIYGHTRLVLWIGGNVPNAVRRRLFEARNAMGMTAQDIALSRQSLRVSKALESLGVPATLRLGQVKFPPYSEKAAWDVFQNGRQRVREQSAI